jgi:hypothetical protein
VAEFFFNREFSQEKNVPKVGTESPGTSNGPHGPIKRIVVSPYAERVGPIGPIGPITLDYM